MTELELKDVGRESVSLEGGGFSASSLWVLRFLLLVSSRDGMVRVLGAGQAKAHLSRRESTNRTINRDFGVVTHGSGTKMSALFPV